VKTFRGRVAVVTGAASGIGLALAERFAAEGMKVVMADIEAPALEAAAARLRGAGATVQPVRVDVSRPEDLERLARETYEAHGAAHVLCNNAGVAVLGALHEHTLADWQWVINVNLWGVIHGVRAFLPRMLAGGDEGHIVNTASMAGLTTAPYMSVYDVTKHGVVALSESMYKEFQLSGAPIRVSVVCPGLIDTNIMRSSRNRPAELAESGKTGAAAQGFGEALAARLAGGYPPGEVAEQVLRGIREERFYVVPAQPEVKSAIGVRAQDLLELRNPTLARGASGIAGLDHVVIVVRDFETALAFYTGALGCEPLGVEDWRQGRRRFPSLRAGRTMINVHQEGRPVGLDAKTMQAGSEDLCFEWIGPIEGALERLRAHGVPVEVGPVKRFGARGREGTSVYFRDPDGNLLELMSYD
jgi:NAD(P)-dependent dehydrogenase (short-subunit alcohol dehydrogenase family)/catechol 2,3-dioxygenase-like lactoylglutathione lyase family enzyme